MDELEKSLQYVEEYHVEKIKEMRQFLLYVVKAYSIEKAKRKELMPYHINIIEELHINENAHSRILIKLLRYNRKGDYAILKSFMELINNKCKDKLPTDNISIPIISSQEYIDALIEEKGKYAIIVENKINDAVDQKRQIDRYVETVKTHGFTEADKNIFVIYLTRNGNKRITNDSFSKAKNDLDYRDETNSGRYIPMSYKNDILPWLKNEVLPNSPNIDQWVISALYQYIDFLKGMFNLRKGEDSMSKEILNEILELDTLQIGERLNKLESCLAKIQELNNDVSNYRQQLIHELYEKFANRISSNILGTMTVNNSGVFFKSKGGLVKGCDKFYFYFEFFYDSRYIKYCIGTDTNDFYDIPSDIVENLPREFSDYIFNSKSDFWLSNEMVYDQSELVEGLLNSSIADFLISKYDDIKQRLNKIGYLNKTENPI